MLTATRSTGLAYRLRPYRPRLAKRRERLDSNDRESPKQLVNVAHIAGPSPTSTDTGSFRRPRHPRPKPVTLAYAKPGHRCPQRPGYPRPHRDTLAHIGHRPIDPVPRPHRPRHARLRQALTPSSYAKPDTLAYAKPDALAHTHPDCLAHTKPDLPTPSPTSPGTLSPRPV